uniref:Uncharacterized protein n=1 Tax=Strigamia maritima TaxID=126957 RepID=T1JFE3_STRMM
MHHISAVRLKIYYTAIQFSSFDLWQSPMCLLDNCCCICPLRYGSLVAANWTLLGVIIQFVLVLTELRVGKYSNVTTSHILDTISSILGLISFFCLIIAIFGTHKTYLIIPWLVLSAIRLGIFIGTITIAVMSEKYLKLLGTIYVTIYFYLWLVVLSYYKFLKSIPSDISTYV